jgi:hypothetical protein
MLAIAEPTAGLILTRLRPVCSKSLFRASGLAPSPLLPGLSAAQFSAPNQA